MKMISNLNIELSSLNSLVPDKVPKVLTLNSPSSYNGDEKLLVNPTSFLLNGSVYKRRQYFLLAPNIIYIYI